MKKWKHIVMPAIYVTGTVASTSTVLSLKITSKTSAEVDKELRDRLVVDAGDFDRVSKAAPTKNLKLIESKYGYISLTFEVNNTKYFSLVSKEKFQGVQYIWTVKMSSDDESLNTKLISKMYDELKNGPKKLFNHETDSMIIFRDNKYYLDENLKSIYNKGEIRDIKGNIVHGSEVSIGYNIKLTSPDGAVKEYTISSLPIVKNIIVPEFDEKGNFINKDKFIYNEKNILILVASEQSIRK